MSDLLVVVLIAEAATEALASNARSLPDGILLASTIVFWAYALDWLGFRFALDGRLLRPPALPLVRDGQLLHRNMRRELVTEDERKIQLRQHSVHDVTEVREAYIEGDDQISVVTNRVDATKKNKRPTPNVKRPRCRRPPSTSCRCQTDDPQRHRRGAIDWCCSKNEYAVAFV